MKKALSLLLALALAASLLAGCAGSSAPGGASSSAAASVSASAPPASEAGGTAAPAGANANNGAYLRHYFSIEPTADWTADTFSAALKSIVGEDAAAVEGELAPAAALKAAVISAGYEELALSYPDEKVTARLAAYGIEEAPENAAYFAAALDLGMLNAATGKSWAAGTQPDAAGWEMLLMSVAEAAGLGRNTLNYSNSPDIYAQLEYRWNSFTMFNDEALTELGRTAVEQGVTTGYNQKDAVYSARFLPDLTLQYGHDDIRHAQQLIGLLNSEGIVARVQLEPKVSVYQYMLEWGPVPDPEPFYEVRQFSDELYLVFAVEYDLMLEFANEQDMLAFNNIITSYAKKNEGNEDAVGLIYSSWWQPLYSTTREGMPEEDYRMIYDCVVTNGDYSIHPFCLPENLDETVAALEAIQPDITVEPVARYCNVAFYNYLTGDDFQ